MPLEEDRKRLMRGSEEPGKEVKDTVAIVGDFRFPEQQIGVFGDELRGDEAGLQTAFKVKYLENPDDANPLIKDAGLRIEFTAKETVNDVLKLLQPKLCITREELEDNPLLDRLSEGWAQEELKFETIDHFDLENIQGRSDVIKELTKDLDELEKTRAKLADRLNNK